MELWKAALMGFLAGLAISFLLWVLEKKEYIPSRQDLLFISAGLIVLFQGVQLVMMLLTGG